MAGDPVGILVGERSSEREREPEFVVPNKPCTEEPPALCTTKEDGYMREARRT
jgi:hypothetical protein